MRSFAIVIRRAYFEAKKRRKYAKNVVVSRSGLSNYALYCLWNFPHHGKRKRVENKGMMFGLHVIK